MILNFLSSAEIATQLIIESAIVVGTKVRDARALKAIDARTAASVVPDFYVSLPSDLGAFGNVSKLTYTWK